MPKLTAANINAVATLLITGVTAGTKVWKALNEDEAVSEKVKAMTAKVKETAKVTDPGDRLNEQLQVIATAIDALPPDHSRRADWQSRVETLRGKIPLALAQTGAQRRASLKALRARTSALLAEVIGDDIGSPERPAIEAGDTHGLRGRVRRITRRGAKH